MESVRNKWEAQLDRDLSERILTARRKCEIFTQSTNFRGGSYTIPGGPWSEKNNRSAQNRRKMTKTATKTFPTHPDPKLQITQRIFKHPNKPYTIDRNNRHSSKLSWELVNTWTQLFVVVHVFQGLMQILMNQEKLEVQILRIILTDNPGIHEPHCDEYYHENEKEDWGQSFHVSLFPEGSYIFRYYHKLNCIQKVHINFGYLLLTRNDVCNGGFAVTKGKLRLHGSFHSNSHETGISWINV